MYTGKYIHTIPAKVPGRPEISLFGGTRETAGGLRYLCIVEFSICEDGEWRVLWTYTSKSYPHPVQFDAYLGRGPDPLSLTVREAKKLFLEGD